MPNRRKFTETEVAEMLVEWQAGVSVRSLATSRSSNWTTVWKYLSKGMMNNPRIRKCADCPELLKGSPNGKWKKRCDPCHIQFEYRSRVRYNRLRVTGVSHAQYQAMLSAQKGLCAICHNGPTANRSLGVDHDHVTLQVRALLCNLCNVGIGAFKDDVDVMKSAIEYLEKYDALSPGKRTGESKTRSRPGIRHRDPQVSSYGSTSRHLRSKSSIGRRDRGERNESGPRGTVN